MAAHGVAGALAADVDGAFPVVDGQVQFLVREDGGDGECELFGGEGEAPDGGVGAAAFSHDGRHLVTASGDNTARLGDAETGACRLVLFPARNGWAAYDPNTFRYRGEGEALEILKYYDPDEDADIRTLWPIADLPWMRMDDDETFT